MLDIKFVRENKELVKENIKKKFQDKKIPLVDEVLELDEITLEDCLNLFKTGKIMLIEDGRITNILEEGD